MLSPRIHPFLGLAGIMLLAVNPGSGAQLAMRFLLDAAASIVGVDAARPEPIEVEPDGLMSTGFIEEGGSEQ